MQGEWEKPVAIPLPAKRKGPSSKHVSLCISVVESLR